ncbi:bifunctional DNA primase/polymerase [Ruegeria faecimaris]|uniref:bifunctional DNA primase/polymerase n=1 Tax=Ruegeria faecimaris TaxID=686389 RepID=UPI002490D61D|nr:bifunctional DNA primase/polymerase [Ruegeria faecimaris]
MTESFLANKINNGSAAEAALAYTKLGWEPLRLLPREKHTKDNWKEPRKWAPDEITQAFAANNNVGVIMGARSGSLVDIDLDIPEAVLIADFVFPEFTPVGRKTSPRSHRLAICAVDKSQRFQIPPKVAKELDFGRATVLELRADGNQTMFPPSTHPSDEKVQWQGSPEDIPTVSADDLAKRCGLCAGLAVLLRYYPRVQGDRDNVCLALTGVLVRAGYSDEDVDQIVVALAAAAGDEEAEQRSGKAAASREKIKDEEPTWGLPELCERLEIEGLEGTLRKWLGLSSAGSAGRFARDGKPTILVEPGSQPYEIDEVEDVLMKADTGVYQRGENLVRVSRLPRSIGEDGVKRSGGALVLTRVITAWLREQFARIAKWERPTKDGSKPINPPVDHAATYIARVGEWRVPVLNGIISTPTLRADGSILQTPGYDYESGLLYDPGDAVFDPVPEAPSKEEAMEALHVLWRPFRDFRFSEPVDKSVLLAATLTAFIRRSLRTAPLFALDAPTAGSGKTYVAATIGIMAYGHSPTIISQGKTEEEDEKRIGAVLMAGDGIVVIDNCDRPISGDSLCTVLTTEEWGARILGKSEVAKTPTNALFMATGNNLEVAGDMGRRTLVCRLDPQTERPDLVEHDFDPREEAAENRTQLVAAGLTILRAYIAAGRPKQSTPIGSFREWNLVRDALLWLGLPDPAVTRERIMLDDPMKSELAGLLDAWVAALGDREYGLAEIGAMAEESSSPEIKELFGALVAMTRNGQFNTKSIGRLLLKHKDRIVGGRVLRSYADSAGSKRYRVEFVGSHVPDVPDDMGGDMEFPF